ncbi:MAG TPA: isoprenylcysteine carboxylmethyltransferase family protein [Gammaproteobacteria bacterium]|nr:isoprenylcysteine carboxylmethyltransferase family protein [Gammaproteobacteria bacterium]
MSALITHSVFHLNVLYIVTTLCFAPEWIGSFFQRPERTAQNRDRGSHLVLFGAIVAGMFAAFALAFGQPAASLGWHQALQFWCGIGLMLAGLGFRWYAIRVLGKFFTRDVATRPGQYVVETGPYRLVRHPSYSGGLLMLLGAGLAMTNWLSLLVLCAAMLIGYGYRVHVEEQALCRDLGEPYREYMQRTHRFVPHVW